MIARRGVHVALLAAVLVALGLLLGHAPLLVWGLATGAVLAAGLSARPAHGLTARLAHDRNRPRVGDTIRFQVDLDARHGIGPVLVHVPLPDTLQLAQGSNLHLLWKGPRRLNARIHFHARAAARGPVRVGAVEAQAIHPLRLRTGTTQTLGTPLAFSVEPRVRRVPRLRHLRGHGVTLKPSGDAARLGPRGKEFEEVRPYAHGDPLRSVNWKASARLSVGEDVRLMVNEFAAEGRKSVWLFLDGGAHMEIGSTRENTLDAAVEGALGVLAYFLERGYRAGATLYHQKDTRVYYPDVGSRQLGRITQALATLVAHSGGDPLDRAVLRTRGFLLRERPLVILVTRPEAEPAATRRGLAQLRAITGHGTRASPVLLIAPAPVTHLLASGHHPVTAAALQLAGRASYQDLRRRGVRVIDWDPARAPLERLIMREVVAR